MIQIAIIVATSLAIMVASLLNYTPNYKKVVNSDFMRRSYDYANYRAMEEAQLLYRAGILVADTPVDVSDAGCLYQVSGEATCLKLTGNVLYSGDINVKLGQNVQAVK